MNRYEKPHSTMLSGRHVRSLLTIVQLKTRKYPVNTCLEQMCPRPASVCSGSAQLCVNNLPGLNLEKDQLILSNQLHIDKKFKYRPRNNKLRHWWSLAGCNLVEEARVHTSFVLRMVFKPVLIFKKGRLH